MGYWLTVRPVNQLAELQEEMVEARERVEAAQSEAAKLQANIGNFHAKIAELERERESLNAGVQQARLRAEQANQEAESAKQEAGLLRTRFKQERVALIEEQERFRNRMASERAIAEAEFAEQLLSERARAQDAELRAMTSAEEKRRMQVFNTLRGHVFAACLAPRAELFRDVTDELSDCITATAERHREQLALTEADLSSIGAWARRESQWLERRQELDAPRFIELGRLVVDETFNSSIACGNVQSSSGEIVELRQAGRISGRRCIGIERMSGAIGAFVARYGGLQSAVEAALSGAAEKRDPTKFAVPAAPVLRIE